MKTRIEVYEIKRPTNIASSGMWNRRLSASEERQAVRELMRFLDPKLFTFRVICE